MSFKNFRAFFCQNLDVMIIEKGRFSIHHFDAGGNKLVIIFLPQHCGQAAFFLDCLPEMKLPGSVIPTLNRRLAGAVF